MKNTFNVVALLLVGVLTLFSCDNKNDEPQPEIPVDLPADFDLNNLIGQWDWVSSTYEGTTISNAETRCVDMEDLLPHPLDVNSTFKMIEFDVMEIDELGHGSCFEEIIADVSVYDPCRDTTGGGSHLMTETVNDEFYILVMASGTCGQPEDATFRLLVEDYNLTSAPYSLTVTVTFSMFDSALTGVTHSYSKSL